MLPKKSPKCFKRKNILEEKSWKTSLALGGTISSGCWNYFKIMVKIQEPNPGIKWNNQMKAATEKRKI